MISSHFIFDNILVVSLTLFGDDTCHRNEHIFVLYYKHSVMGKQIAIWVSQVIETLQITWMHQQSQVNTSIFTKLQSKCANVKYLVCP